MHDPNTTPKEQKRYKILKLANKGSCQSGHQTYYRLITTDGMLNYCMICFALGWADTDREPLELTGRLALPEKPAHDIA